MGLKFQHSMVFDAICACNLVENHKNCNGKQNEFLDILKEKSEGFFLKGGLSYSTLCGIISAYTESRGISEMSLDDLFNIFTNIEEVDRIVRSRIKNEFIQSFMFKTLDALKNKWAEIYCGYIKKLKEIGYESLWKEYVLPVEKEQIEKLEKSTESLDIDAILKIVSELKCEEKRDEAEIYVSLISFPTSFTLYGGAFLDAVNDYGTDASFHFSSIIAHELMHGFESKKLLEQYLLLMKSSRYLRSSHDILIHTMNSGDEEEFVMAAEYYIMLKTGAATKEKIIIENYSRYGGCVPLSIAVFNLMSKEEKPICDYNNYLLDKFGTGAFSSESVIRLFDEMLPAPTNLVNFYANLFTAFQRLAVVIKDAQESETPDFEKKIGECLDSEFIESNEGIIDFGKEIKKTPENMLYRKTLSKDGIVIDAVSFKTRKEAFDYKFAYCGSNIGAFPLEIDREIIKNPYILNLNYKKTEPMRIEISLVIGCTRYLIISRCGDDVMNINTENERNLTETKFGADIMKAVRKAEKIVMLLNN